MVIRRSRGYQDIEGSTNSSLNSRTELPDPDLGVTQEIEMASVSVVPDGKLYLRKFIHLLRHQFYRYFYGHSSG